MKRFFIFAAMLLTLSAYAGSLNEDPPLITPAVEQIVLVPKGMYDIDRSIAVCEYTISEGMITVSCFGIGCMTELYLIDSNGYIMQHASIDTDMTPVTTFYKPEAAGTYYLVVNSVRYYGEGSIIIE
jgi:hypothetical protein